MATGLRRVMLNGDDMKLGFYQNSVVFRKHSPRLQAVIDYALSQGYPKPEFEYLKILDKLLIAIEPLIQRMDVFYIFSGDPSLVAKEFKCINIVNPLKHEITPHNIAFDTEYARGNGTDAWLEPHFTAFYDGNNYSYDRCSRGTIIKNYPNGLQQRQLYVDGTDEMNNGIQLASRDKMDTFFEATGEIMAKTGNGIGFNGSGNGLKIITRTVQTVSYYKNYQVMTTMNNMVQDRASTYPHMILRTNLDGGGTTEQFYSMLSMSMYYMGDNFGKSEAEKLMDAFNQYYSDCGMTLI